MAGELIPEKPSLPRLREAAAGCRGCGLWRDATQTVFGEGAERAAVMLVGEQPGDRDAFFAECVRRWADQVGIASEPIQVLA
jgi:hypothetical protein